MKDYLRSSSVRQFAEVLLVVAGVVTARWALRGSVTQADSLLLLLAAIAYVACRLGTGPAIATAILGYGLSGLALYDPEAPDNPVLRTGAIALFCLASAAVIIVGHLYHTFRKQSSLSRKKALDQDDRLSLALEAGRLGTWEWDVPSGRVRWSRELEQIHGRTPGTFEGTLEDFTQEIHPDDKSMVAGKIQQLLEGVDRHDIEYRIVLPDGEVRWLEGRGKVERDHRGRARRVRGVCSDITDRKTAEQAISRKAGELAALYEFTDRLHRAESLDAVYGAALDAILSAVSCDRASILLFDDSGVMRFVGWHGLSEHYRKAVEGHSPWNEADRAPRAFGVSDVETADLAEGLGQTVLDEGIRALGFVPLISEGELIGKFMVYFDQPHELTHLELELAQTIAKQISFAISKRRAEGQRLAVEHALSISERRYRHLIELLPVAMFTCEAPSGRLNYYNEHAARLWGRSPDLTSPDERYCGSLRLYNAEGVFVPHDQCPMAKGLLEGESVRNREVIFEREDGSRVTVLVNVDPIRDDDGQIVGAVNVFLDITALKDAERAVRESENRFRTMANITPAIIWTANPAGTITWASDRWFEYTGLDREQNGHGWTSVLHPDDYDSCMDAWETAVATGGDYSAEVRNRGRDGEYRWFVTRAIPRLDAGGKIIEWYGSTTDIHDLKQAEAALFEADRRKDEFLATLAHELRNPLSPLASGLDYVNRPEATPEGVRHIHEIMMRQVEHLGRLVDDLLDISRIKRGILPFHMRVGDLREAIMGAVDMIRPGIGRAGQQLVVDVPESPLFVDFDPQRVTQVFGNLLFNAYKFTPDGGRIEVVAREERGCATVEVRDSGTGISEEDLGHIFEPFMQIGNNLSHRPVGLGVGLSLASQIISGHRGTLHAASAGPGLGSVFTVCLPVAQHPEPKHERDPSLDHAVDEVAPKRILVVDDNEDAANSLAMLLSMDGHASRAFYSGAAALAECQMDPPDLLLLDLGMPGMDGYEVAARLRESAQTNGIRIVALTGWGQDADIERTQKAGFHGHLVKPAGLAKVRELLEKFDAESRCV